MAGWLKKLLVVAGALVGGGIAMLVFAGRADAYAIYNHSNRIIRYEVWDGDDKKQSGSIAAGSSSACLVSTPAACGGNGSDGYGLKLVLRTGESTDPFECQVALHAGGYGEFQNFNRSYAGLTGVPDDYRCVSFSAADGLVDVEPPGIGSDGGPSGTRLRDVRFTVTADPQYDNRGLSDGDHGDQELMVEFADQVMAIMTFRSDYNRDAVGMRNTRGIIVAGDLTQNSRKDEFDRYKESMEGYDHLVYDGLGNHDVIVPTTAQDLACPHIDSCVDPDDIADWVKRGRSTRQTNRNGSHYSWDWHDIHFVQLNVVARDEDPPAESCEAEHQCDKGLQARTFLQSDLQTYVGTSGRPVVVIAHYGFDCFSTGGCGNPPAVWWTEAERTEFLNVIKPYNVVAMFSGHTHLNRHDTATEATTTCGTNSNWVIEVPMPAGSANPCLRNYVAGASLAGIFLNVEVDRFDYLRVERIYVDRSGVQALNDSHSFCMHPCSQLPPKITFRGAVNGQFAPELHPTWFGSSQSTVQEVPVRTTAQVRKKNPDGSWGAFSPTNHGVVYDVEGVYQINVHAVEDLTGRTADATLEFTIDRTPPSLQVNGVPEPWATSDVTPSFVHGTGSVLDVVLQGNEISPPFTLTLDGVYHLVATATDKAGNTTTITKSFTIDKTPPALALNGIANVATASYNHNVTVTPVYADANGATLTFTVNGGHEPPPATLVGEGTYVIVAVATDAAGHSTRLERTVIIDRTPPVITTTIPNGWANGPVTLAATTNEPATVQYFVTPSGFGSERPAGTVLGDTGLLYGVLVRAIDIAGNLTEITRAFRIDTTPPVVALVSRTPTDGPGWNHGPVTVVWSCSDPESGVADAHPAVTLSAEGRDQVADVSCVNGAGATVPLSLDRISVDLHDPVATLVSVTTESVPGWHNTPVTIVWECRDDFNYSGTPDSITSTITVTLSDDGADQSVNRTCSDQSARSVPVSMTGINIDQVAPDTVFVSITPESAPGWHNTNVTVEWSCIDGLSGALRNPVKAVVDDEGEAKTAKATCMDAAGNRVDLAHPGINIDWTPPSVSGAPATAATNGWYTGSVTIVWTCTDGGSGLAAPCNDSVIDREGTGLTTSITVRDKAGNEITVESPPVSIDQTPPEIDLRTPLDGARYLIGDRVIVDFDCVELVSTIASCTATLADGEAIDTSTVGVRTFTVTATDVAGNTVTKTVTYTVASRTQLVAKPIVAVKDILRGKISLAMEARLTASGGAPLAGKTVTFSAGNTVLCTATTDAGGVASCTGVVPLLSAILSLGYKATFAADQLYNASSTTGAILGL